MLCTRRRITCICVTHTGDVFAITRAHTHTLNLTTVLRGDSVRQACLPQCDVESLILDTMQRIKAINPSVSCILYLNTLLDFPFYKLHGTFLDAGLDVIDLTTHEPIRIVNDNGMKGIYVFGYDKPAGVQMYVRVMFLSHVSVVLDGEGE